MNRTIKMVTSILYKNTECTEVAPSEDVSAGYRELKKKKKKDRKRVVCKIASLATESRVWIPVKAFYIGTEERES